MPEHVVVSSPKRGGHIAGARELDWVITRTDQRDLDLALLFDSQRSRIHDISEPSSTKGGSVKLTVKKIERVQATVYYHS